MPLMWMALFLLILLLAGFTAVVYDIRIRSASPRFHVRTIEKDPHKLDEYLARSEGGFSDIRAGLQKQIVWAGSPGVRTEISIVYIHGFSASSAELRPVPDMVAKALGANLFFTRLAGHGRGSEPMAHATIGDWLADFGEAVDIAETIGETTFLIATSTGATLAAYALTRKEFRGRVGKMSLVAPNFGIRSAFAFLLTAPFARVIAHAILGRYHEFQPANDSQSAGWTVKYPTSALLPMARLVRIARFARLDKIASPALVILSREDQVVDAEKTFETMKKWGGALQYLDIVETGDPANHVIAGDAMSPRNNVVVANAIAAFFQTAE